MEKRKMEPPAKELNEKEKELENKILELVKEDKNVSITDIYYYLKADNPKDKRVIKEIVSKLEKEEKIWHCDKYYRYSYLFGFEDKYRKEIFDFYNQIGNRGVSTTELANLLKIPKYDIWQLLKKLQIEGKIYYNSTNGTWRLKEFEEEIKKGESISTGYSKVGVNQMITILSTKKSEEKLEIPKISGSIKERVKGSFVIPIISEYSGGTIAFNPTMNVGVSVLLEKIKKKFEIPALIINGGILPEVPVYATKVTENKIKYLLTGINNIEDSIKLVQNHIKFIRKALGYEHKIYYVFGDEDEANIQVLKHKKITILKDPKSIQMEIERLRNSVEETEERLKLIMKEREEVYNKLEKERNNKKREILIGRGKHLSRLIQEYKNAIKSKSEDIARHQIQLKEHPTRSFTKLYEWLSKEENYINQLVLREYTGILKQVLGSGETPILLRDAVNYININGLAIAIGHNLISTSRIYQTSAMAKTTYLFNREFVNKIAPSYDAVIFTHAPYTKVNFEPKEYLSDESVLFLQTCGFYDPRVLEKCRAKKINVPQIELIKKGIDAGITLLYVNDGLIDIECIGYKELEEMGEERIAKEKEKINLNTIYSYLPKVKGVERKEIAENVPLTMQNIELSFPFNVTPKDLARYIKYRILIDLINKGEIDERQIKEDTQNIFKIYENLVDEKIKKMNKEEILNKMREYLQLNNENETKNIKKEREIKIVGLADLHTGIGSPINSESNYELVDRFILDSKARGMPDILILGGDMVHGASPGALKSEAEQKYLLDEVRETLEKISEIDIKESNEKKVKELINRLKYSLPVMNVETQFKYLRPLIEYAVEIIKKGGDVIVVSGNHYNASQAAGRFDEATRIAAQITDVGKLSKEEEERIHVISGLYGGVGSVVVKGIPIFCIHRAKKSIDKTTGLAEYKIRQRRNVFLSVKAHDHTAAWQKGINDVTVALPSFGMPHTKYAEELGCPEGVQGYYEINIKVREEVKTEDIMGKRNNDIEKERKEKENSIVTPLSYVKVTLVTKPFMKARI